MPCACYACRALPPSWVTAPRCRCHNLPVASGALPGQGGFGTHSSMDESVARKVVCLAGGVARPTVWLGLRAPARTTACPVWWGARATALATRALTCVQLGFLSPAHLAQTQPVLEGARSVLRTLL